MKFGIDYASVTPDAKALKAAGVEFVCRYVSTAGNPKNVTAAEAKALKSAGVDVVVVFETTANRALAGHAAGVSDAQSARKQTAAVGLPKCAVYFAVDFDMSPAQASAVEAYFRGAASVLGKKKTGVYGGYAAVKHVLDAGVAKFGWQTYAWSYGMWDARAQLRQVKNGQHTCGVSCDHDNAVSRNFGQSPGPVKKRVHKVVKKVKKYVTVDGLFLLVGSAAWKWWLRNKDRIHGHVRRKKKV